MLISETAKILAKAQLLDNRLVDPETIKAWHEVIGHLDFRDAMTGLNAHRAESSDYLMPAHVVTQARKARRVREVHESRHRAIEVAKEREALGADATPVEVAKYRELKAKFGTALKLVDDTRAAPANLYERLKNSPEGRATMNRPA